MARIGAAAVGSAKSWIRDYRYTPKPARLGPVQWMVVQLTACGLSDKDTARVIGISTATVKAHNSKAMRILGLRRRGQLVRYIFETGQFCPEIVERDLCLRRDQVRPAVMAPNLRSVHPADV